MEEKEEGCSPLMNYNIGGLNLDLEETKVVSIRTFLFPLTSNHEYVYLVHICIQINI